MEAIDQAGNVSAPQTYTWLVDAVPPTVKLTTTPPAITNSSSATFAFSGNDNDTPPDQLIFEVSLDGSSFSPATSPVNYTEPCCGQPARSRLRAIDAVGNVSKPATFTWIIDQTAPTVMIGKTPGNPTNQTTATFTFTGTDNVTPNNLLVFDVSLDGGDFVASTSPRLVHRTCRWQPHVSGRINRSGRQCQHRCLLHVGSRYGSADRFDHGTARAADESDIGHICFFGHWIT